MKCAVRTGVFETNSSSSHSLCFGKTTNINFYPPEVVNVEPGEFGWGYETLTTLPQKLSYIITSIANYDDNVRDFDDLLESKYFIWLKEMLFEFSFVVVNLQKNDFVNIGYVDHQSTDILNDFWSEEESEFKENMKKILFDDNCYIEISNDNG